MRKVATFYLDSPTITRLDRLAHRFVGGNKSLAVRRLVARVSELPEDDARAMLVPTRNEGDQQEERRR